MHRRLRTAAVAALLIVPLSAAGLAQAAGTAGGAGGSTGAGHAVKLPNGSTVTWSGDGTGSLTTADGRTQAFPVPRSAGRTGLGATISPTDSSVTRRAEAAQTPGFTLASGTSAPAARAAEGAPIQPMNTGGVKLPAAVTAAVGRSAAGTRKALAVPSAASGVPTNAGLTTSLDSYLDAQGVDAVGTFHDASAYLHALPGAGEIVTNVSIGDLTDQSMADAGDGYVQNYGPTTILKGGQRYLDIPSMPLIPTYVADDNAKLDPTGSTENEDPALGEVLLDFSMMAPLPHDAQRPGATGSGATDLLGIAPGASYRLVVPKDPSYQGIDAALLAAAHQTPKPDVITASLGFGTDEELGYPGRYLEDDPTLRATLASIVKSGITVVVSANDGTRLVLPVSVGPDGGSTPTERTTDARAQTDIDDVEPSSTPSLEKDSGVIAVGATTTDDTLTSPDVRQGVYPTTRYNGSAAYSSGFGSRVDIAAPGDDLPSFEHVCSSDCSAQDVSVVLNGGTSASAPETAAAVADVLQAAKATHQSLTPQQVRSLLVATGKRIAQPPQADQPLTMGTQLDVTAAYEKVLSRKFAIPTASVGMSVAERQLLPTSEGTAFQEQTDPADIDLTGPADMSGRPSGQNAVSPITFGLDMTGAGTGLTYRLTVAGEGVIDSAGPSLRVLPAELFKAAGLPATSTASRTLPVTFQALRDGHPVATGTQTLTFTATDGGYEQAQAPDVAGTTALGKPVTVSYDLTGVRGLDAPRLVLSSVGHYTPTAAVDTFNARWSTPLTASKGTVTIPASAFAAGGAGLYGVGVEQSDSVQPVYGDFRAFTVGAGARDRAATPLVAAPGGTPSHATELTRQSPKLTVSWNVSSVPGANGAEVEVLAPAPTLYGSVNTTTNQNGSKRDDDGFNHPSTLVRALPGTRGSTSVDFAAAGIPSGLQYPVRVLATRDGTPIGQASPTSFVEYLDGDQSAGGIEGFTVTGDKALISTDEFSAGPTATTPYVLDSSATAPYALGTGKLGSPIIRSTTGDLMAEIVGTDAAGGHSLVLRVPFGSTTSAEIDVIGSTTGATVKDTTLTSLGMGADSYLQSGTVDPVRHRAAVSVFDGDTGLDSVYPVDMTTGEVGAPIVVNSASPGRAYSNLSFDSSTGALFVATSGTMGPCLSGRAPYSAARADLTTGKVTPLSSLPLCTAGLLPDGRGGKLYVSVGAAQPDPESGTFPTSSWVTEDQGTLTATATADTGTLGPEWPTLDTTHHVAVEASLYESGFLTDNNAMSEITVLDPDTGKVLARHPVANVINSTVSGSNFDFTSRQGLYLDPASRTGWVVDPWGTGLERFTY